jgi:bifunctional DNA-binding transcriptional regulator/antitoxin component of YhaV-PrlF toxin-antitoxin module
MEKLLVNSQYKIEKQAAKFGWHFVVISEIATKHRNKLGLVRVKGFVDDYEIKQFNLLPMKDGNMLFPIKEQIRKKIGKKEGDFVQIQLFTDNSEIVIPLEILESLEQSPKAFRFFNSLSDSNQKYYIDWIAEAKKPETKVERMLKTIEKLEKGVRFWDWPKQD